MSKPGLAEFYLRCIVRSEEYPEWRLGQIYFNVLAELRGNDFANQVINTDLDPFYFDRESQRVSKFLEWLEKNW